MTDINDPRFFQSVEISWPIDNPVREVLDFVDGDDLVRETIQADGTRRRFPVGQDIHL